MTWTSAVKIQFGKKGDGTGALVYRQQRTENGVERGDTIAHFFETQAESYEEACARAQAFADSLANNVPLGDEFKIPPTTREALVAALASAPAEVFGYVMTAAQNINLRYGADTRFSKESRDAMAAIGKAAEAYMRSPS